MTYPVLYSFRRCPYAMRARMAILLAGQKVELRDILLRDKPTEMLAASPKGTVPVLVLPDGTVIDESLDVMLWALGIADPDGLLEGASESLALIRQNDGDFKTALDRYKYITRYPDEADTDWRAKGEVFLQTLEDRLNKNIYLLAPKPRLADYAIFPFIRQFRMPDADWFDNTAPYPNLRTWLTTFTERPTFKKVKAKHPQWQVGDTPKLWP